MFYMSYSTPAPIAGVIEVSEPIGTGLGNFTDIHGRRWNVGMYSSMAGLVIVAAVELSRLHPYYTDTSGTTDFGLVSQRWKPYEVRVVEQ